jgi:hypothetical protein
MDPLYVGGSFPARPIYNQAMTAALASQETLDACQKSHSGETPQQANYQADENWTDSNFRFPSSRCAFSVANPTAEIPADPEAVFAWQEGWRLQAGLNPTRVPFGCTGE